MTGATCPCGGDAEKCPGMCSEITGKAKPAPRPALARLNNEELDDAIGSTSLRLLAFPGHTTDVQKELEKHLAALLLIQRDRAMPVPGFAGDERTHVICLCPDCQAKPDRVIELAMLTDRLRQEAQVHAQEARTANATIAEIYQVLTGGRGEPGNWHGAEPVRKLMHALRGVVANAGRLSSRKKARWSHVSDATAEGSNTSAELCRVFGFDPDEEVGGRR